jgi:hypothetical protein
MVLVEMMMVVGVVYDIASVRVVFLCFRCCVGFCSMLWCIFFQSNYSKWSKSVIAIWSWHGGCHTRTRGLIPMGLKIRVCASNLWYSTRYFLMNRSMTLALAWSKCLFLLFFTEVHFHLIFSLFSFFKRLFLIWMLITNLQGMNLCLIIMLISDLLPRRRCCCRSFWLTARCSGRGHGGSWRTQTTADESQS